jgi:VWFA-related protein
MALVENGTVRKVDLCRQLALQLRDVRPMRTGAIFLMSVSAAFAQFKSTVPLVVAPTTVTDSKGRYVDGLSVEDLILYDNNVPQKIQLDYAVYPISVVIAVETRQDSIPVLDKLGRSGVLVSQLLAGDAGETAVISFSDEVRVYQDFTTDSDKLTRALRNMRADGEGSAALDGVSEALRMLSHRQPNRRKVILLIAEKRDRGSRAKLAEVIHEVERQNCLIYWLTYSPSLTQYTARPKTVKSDDKREDGKLLPPDIQPKNPLVIFSELYHLSKPDIAELFAKETGAHTKGFLKRSGLEEGIQAIGEEVHRQYILTFQPAPSPEGQFHSIRVAVKDRPELQARTRGGYFTVQ